VSGEELRALMSRVPSGVAVVTVNASGQRVGLTVGSLVTLSLEPPLVAIVLSRQAAMHELLRQAGGFGVSILAAEQERLAQHFARGVPPIALWERIPLRDPDAAGPPQLADAGAWLRGRVEQEHPTGDHTFFVAIVESAEAGQQQRPLLLHDQAYAAL